MTDENPAKQTDSESPEGAKDDGEYDITYSQSDPPEYMEKEDHEKERKTALHENKTARI